MHQPQPVYHWGTATDTRHGPFMAGFGGKKKTAILVWQGSSTNCRGSAASLHHIHIVLLAITGKRKMLYFLHSLNMLNAYHFPQPWPVFFFYFLAGSFTRMRWIRSDDVQLEEKIGSRQQSRRNKYGNKVSPRWGSSTANSYITVTGYALLIRPQSCPIQTPSPTWSLTTLSVNTVLMT